MTPVMDFEVLRLLFRFGGQRPFQPFDATVIVFAGREFADEVSVAHAHIDDLFVRAVGRTQKVVHYGELEKLADVSLIADQWDVVERPTRQLRKRCDEIAPLQARHRTRRRKRNPVAARVMPY